MNTYSLKFIFVLLIFISEFYGHLLVQAQDTREKEKIKVNLEYGQARAKYEGTLNDDLSKWSITFQPKNSGSEKNQNKILLASNIQNKIKLEISESRDDVQVYIDEIQGLVDEELNKFKDKVENKKSKITDIQANIYEWNWVTYKLNIPSPSTDGKDSDAQRDRNEVLTALEKELQKNGSSGRLIIEGPTHTNDQNNEETEIESLPVYCTMNSKENWSTNEARIFCFQLKAKITYKEKVSTKKLVHHDQYLHNFTTNIGNGLSKVINSIFPRVYCPTFGGNNNKQKFKIKKGTKWSPRSNALEVCQANPINIEIGDDSIRCERKKSDLISILNLRISLLSDEISDQEKFIHKIEDDKNYYLNVISNIDSIKAIEQKISELKSNIKDKSKDLLFQVPEENSFVIDMDISPSVMENSRLEDELDNLYFLIESLRPDQRFSIVLNSWNVFVLSEDLLNANVANKQKAQDFIKKVLDLKNTYGKDRWKEALTKNPLPWNILSSFYENYSTMKDKPDSWGEPAPGYYLAKKTNAELVLVYTDAEFEDRYDRTYKPIEISKSERDFGDYKVIIKPRTSRTWKYQDISKKGDTILDSELKPTDFTELKRLSKELRNTYDQKRKILTELAKISPGTSIPVVDEKFTTDQITLMLTNLRKKMEIEISRIETSLIPLGQRLVELKIEEIELKNEFDRIYKMPCPASK